MTINTVFKYISVLFSFQQQTQIPDYAELVVKFLDALIDTYLPGIEEEGGEESLRTPTSPYPPTVQSQLSITANLNLSNSMTSLATSQHSPGQSSLRAFQPVMTHVYLLTFAHAYLHLRIHGFHFSQATHTHKGD